MSVQYNKRNFKVKNDSLSIGPIFKIQDLSKITGLNNLKNLKSLKITNNFINEIKELENLTHLQMLDLSNNKIDLIKGLENLRDLRILDISGNRITGIEGLENLTNLQILKLSGNIISEIKGLEGLVNLVSLDLSRNMITEIKGLQNVPNLENLYLNDNNISELKGLEDLTNLKILNLTKNPVHKWIKKNIVIGLTPYAKKMVEYCQKLKIEQSEAIEYIKKLPSIYKEITIEDVIKSTKLSIENVKPIVENLILAGEIEAQLKGNLILFKENNRDVPFAEPVIIKEKDKSFEGKVLEIFRGGDWKIEGNQSVFYYKVKVKNISEYVVNNIQIILLSVPKGLEIQTDRQKIDFLNPKSFVSPVFKLKATESCVGSEIRGIVMYTDAKGNEQTVHIEPFEICYVCNLLTPKQISREEFDQKVDFFEERKLIIDSDFDISELEEKIKEIVINCNFALLQQLQTTQAEGFKKIEAFAQGLYDKQDVALSVSLKKMEDGSTLVLRAMSDKEEKVIDLLKDLSYRMDNIKSDTELIKEYSPLLEEIINKQDNLEIYLKEHLASDWEKIKNIWEDYKNGKISKKELIIQGIKVLGKRFIKKIIKNVSPI